MGVSFDKEKWFDWDHSPPYLTEHATWGSGGDDTQ